MFLDVGSDVFDSSYATSAYSPGIEGVAQRFNVSREVAVLPLSLYVLGLALGPLIAGGLSETFGRRIVYLTCMPLCLIFTLGSGFSKSVATLIVCRTLAGISGAAPIAIGAGTVADIFVPHRRAAGLSLWVLAPFLGPALGMSGLRVMGEFHVDITRSFNHRFCCPRKELAVDSMDHTLLWCAMLPIEHLPERDIQENHTATSSKEARSTATRQTTFTQAIARHRLCSSNADAAY
jgi:MFS family permease